MNVPTEGQDLQNGPSLVNPSPERLLSSSALFGTPVVFVPPIETLSDPSVWCVLLY